MAGRYRLLLLVLLSVGVLAGVAAIRHCVPSHNPLLELLAPADLDLSAAELDDTDTTAGLAHMIGSLEASHQPVPLYLRLVAAEYSAKPRQTATFAVGCYWEGERDLGKLDGVLASRTGLIGRDEVVEVE